MKIQEPIFIIMYDTKEIVKYNYLKNAEENLEAYDIDNYMAFDSNFRKLELFKKDKYNRVGLKAVDSRIDENKISPYLLSRKKVVDNTLSAYELLNNLTSYEDWIARQSSFIPKIFTILCVVCIGVFVVWLIL